MLASRLVVLRSSLTASLRQVDSAQQVQQPATGALSSYETIQHFNDIKEHLHVVKRNIEHIIQKAPVRSLKDQAAAHSENVQFDGKSRELQSRGKIVPDGRNDIISTSAHLIMSLWLGGGFI